MNEVNDILFETFLTCKLLKPVLISAKMTALSLLIRNVNHMEEQPPGTADLESASFLAQCRALAESWLDEYERGIFGDRTLRDILREGVEWDKA